DKEEALDTQAATLGPADPGLDGQHHPRLDRAAARLVCVRRLMGPRADAVRDRMARLTGVAGLFDPGADEPVEVGELGAGTEIIDCARVYREQLVEQFVVARLELPWADVLRVVAPVAVGADPDLEQGRLVRLHRAVARGREGADARSGPNERETEGEVDVAARRPLAVHVAQPERRGLAFHHPGAEIRLHVLHRVRG